MTTRKGASMKVLIVMCVMPFVAVICLPTDILAAHPLITDDTGTQGRGRFQVEVNGGYSRNSADGVVESDTEFAATLIYGITDTLDVAVGVPYHIVSEMVTGETLGEEGFADMEVCLKWRFHEKNGFSLALKPVITLPSGSEEKGLGSGKAGYRVFFIATKEHMPLTFHLNIGYIRNENDLHERKDLWHASLAAEMGVAERLRAAVNGGVEQNTRRGAPRPTFVLAGLIYSIAENLVADAGIKFGLNRAEADYQLLAGMAYRFE